LSGFAETKGRTHIPLEFAPGQSLFIVFRNPIEVAGSSMPRDSANPRVVKTLTGSWDVSFDPQWGGPKSPVRFETLSDWSQRPEDGLRFYSGKASYRKTFEAHDELQGRRTWLHLGKVKDLAEVRLNGTNLGVVWCEPWQIEISPAVRPGENDLEIIVVNQWVNRLIGDSGLPPGKRLTWTTWNPYKPDSPLLESGLLGPITLRTK
jgi:hypothetical protein